MSNNRLVIVITGLSFGGAERVTSFLCNYFSAAGRDVYLISLTKGERAYPLSEAIHVRELSASHTKGKLGKYRFLIGAIRKEIKEIKPSLVLGMMSYSGSLAAVACKGLGIPFIISERNDPNTSVTFSEMEKEIFYFIHHHFVTRAIFQTESARSYYYQKEDSRGTIIPNPLYLEDMPEPNAGVVASHQIISAGRLNKQKNHALLVQAFSIVHVKHPEYKLTIYGEGEERPALEALIKQLGIDSAVSLPGIEKSMFARLQEAEMFVLSSNYEGMPNALIEAMAMGLPCITTDYSEGRGTVVTHERDGLVVPRKNPEALADAMLSLIEHPDKALALGMHAASIRKVLDSNVICKRWLSTIEETESSYYQRKER
ncbi:GalNAc-alpha-(1-_4)-GalNAc-alpha-(1-_3)-diNAcBac-PP-undecaprenol alpha-1,4-N-acetyl-D-galactosaminyltransferase [bioreactor metagenome]|uniref:GalNAc-alpha-(1->4)-GalNAc-alpha-(1->3)-diNAcBac-PP-undecaprenol alpha-1,4-N-acetyl-D-galactosaminyltransferase n=1 Tax=bioreactor metagenome TaxID=1076179 RepID=A0A644X3B7_9ZZZZ|nr:glycosyltransferase [Sphaerochaeta sp.]